MCFTQPPCWCLCFQFNQASAVRSYTKFVMGVSSPLRLSCQQFLACTLSRINAECVSADCSQCSHLSVHAGRWCYGGQQLWVSVFKQTWSKSSTQSWCSFLIGCGLWCKAGCRSSSSLSHLQILVVLLGSSEPQGTSGVLTSAFDDDVCFS